MPYAQNLFTPLKWRFEPKWSLIVADVKFSIHKDKIRSQIFSLRYPAFSKSKLDNGANFNI